MTCAGSTVASSSDLMRCRETVMPRVMALLALHDEALAAVSSQGSAAVEVVQEEL